MEYVTKEEFEAEVKLWKSKGHDYMVRAEFAKEKDGGLITLIVPDYVNPDKEYFIHVEA